VAQKNDRVQREIEELLDKLDTFVPEERFLSKVKSRRKAERGPGLLSRAWTTASRPFRRITLGHVMIAGLILIVTSWLAPGLYGGYDRWASVLGLVFTFGAILMSFLGWDSKRTIAGGPVQKRWRGQVITYEPDTGPSSRVRNWFRKRGR
jgi:hypothetical protein